MTETLRPFGVPQVKSVITGEGFRYDGPSILTPATMTKWLLAILLVVLVTGLLQPALARRFRLGRLPGDLAFRWRGRTWIFPFASILLLSALASLILRWL